MGFDWFSVGCVFVGRLGFFGSFGLSFVGFLFEDKGRYFSFFFVVWGREFLGLGGIFISLF